MIIESLKKSSSTDDRNEQPDRGEYVRMKWPSKDFNVVAEIPK